MYDPIPFPDDYVMLRFWAKIKPVGDCWVWTGTTDGKSRKPGRIDGYGRFKIKGKKVQPHRFAFELAYGKIPDGLVCCHTCATIGCCNPRHIYAGTPKDNTHDSIRDGTHWCLRFVPEPRRGEQHHAAVLTWDIVRSIREDRAIGYRFKDLMAKYPMVSESNMCGILNNTRWRE